MTKDEKKGKGTSFAKGALIGALAGAAAGILLAPKSGKETRKDIKDGAENLAKKSKGLVEKGVDEVKGVLERGKESVEDLADDVKAEIEKRKSAEKK